MRKDESIDMKEYCPDFAAPFSDDTKTSCDYCGKTRSKRDKNYFLSLDIGEQIQNMFEGKLQHLNAINTRNIYITQEANNRTQN